MTIREALKGEYPEQYHIFDSRQEGMDEIGSLLDKGSRKP